MSEYGPKSIVKLAPRASSFILHPKSKIVIRQSTPQGGAAPPGQQPMWGEKEAQELRNGILVVGSFPPHWPALLARERYLSPTILTATAPQSNSGIRWHKLSSSPWLRRLATGRCRSVPLRALVGSDPARTAHFTFFRRRL